MHGKVRGALRYSAKQGEKKIEVANSNRAGVGELVNDEERALADMAEIKS